MGSGDQGVRRFERRWAPRFRFSADLEIEWGSTVLRARTRDISSSGMFIESADPLWVGAGFSAQLTLDKPVKLNCFVKRVEPGRGMGVSIAPTEDHHQEAFQELINHLSGNQT
jgi:PilZ domain